jgi:sulfur carrier protein ThiS
VKVRVRLFGTLGQHFRNYNHAEGLEVKIPDGARIKDLVAHLEISGSDSGFVTLDGRVAKADDELKDGAIVHILQRVFGG